MLRLPWAEITLFIPGHPPRLASNFPVQHLLALVFKTYWGEKRMKTTTKIHLVRWKIGNHSSENKVSNLYDEWFIYLSVLALVCFGLFWFIVLYVLLLLTFCLLHLTKLWFAFIELFYAINNIVWYFHLSTKHVLWVIAEEKGQNINYVRFLFGFFYSANKS